MSPSHCRRGPSLSLIIKHTEQQNNHFVYSIHSQKKLFARLWNEHASGERERVFKAVYRLVLKAQSNFAFDCTTSTPCRPGRFSVFIFVNCFHIQFIGYTHYMHTIEMLNKWNKSAVADKSKSFWKPVCELSLTVPLIFSLYHETCRPTYFPANDSIDLSLIDTLNK